MKRLALVLVAGLFLITCQQHSQKSLYREIKKEFCGIDVSQNYDAYLNKVIEVQAKYPIAERKKITFPVRVNFVGLDDSTKAFNLQRLKFAFENLNLAFKDANIEFKIIESILFIKDETSVDDLYNSLDAEKKFTKRFYKNRVINLFVLKNYKQVVGFSHYPILNINQVIIAQDKLTDPSLVHEFGHFFGLLHTFDNSPSNAELVNIESNCQLLGDKICDTPTDPYGASFIEESCMLYGEYKDEQGNEFCPDLSNYMSYYGRCRNRFTPEQLDRIYFIASKIKVAQLRMKI